VSLCVLDVSVVSGFFCGNFFDRAFSCSFVFFCHIAGFLLSHHRNQIFRSCVSFSSIYFFSVCSISPFSCLCATTQATQLHSNAKILITTPPQRHHLTSYCCFMLCVSALANLSTPLFRRDTFLYSGHISALRFCASLLRNS